MKLTAVTLMALVTGAVSQAMDDTVTGVTSCWTCQDQTFGSDCPNNLRTYLDDCGDTTVIVTQPPTASPSGSTSSICFTCEQNELVGNDCPENLRTYLTDCSNPGSSLVITNPTEGSTCFSCSNLLANNQCAQEDRTYVDCNNLGAAANNAGDPIVSGTCFSCENPSLGANCPENLRLTVPCSGTTTIDGDWNGANDVVGQPRVIYVPSTDEVEQEIIYIPRITEEVIYQTRVETEIVETIVDVPVVKIIDIYEDNPVEQIVYQDNPIEITEVVPRPYTTTQIIYQDDTTINKIYIDDPIANPVTEVITEEVPVEVIEVVYRETPYYKPVIHYNEIPVNMPYEKIVYENQVTIKPVYVHYDVVTYVDTPATTIVHMDRVVERLVDTPRAAEVEEVVVKTQEVRYNPVGVPVPENVYRTVEYDRIIESVKRVAEPVAEVETVYQYYDVPVEIREVREKPVTRTEYIEKTVTVPNYITEEVLIQNPKPYIVETVEVVTRVVEEIEYVTVVVQNPYNVLVPKITTQTERVANPVTVFEDDVIVYIPTPSLVPVPYTEVRDRPGEVIYYVQTTVKDTVGTEIIYTDDEVTGTGFFIDSNNGLQYFFNSNGERVYVSSNVQYFTDSNGQYFLDSSGNKVYTGN